MDTYGKWLPLGNKAAVTQTPPWPPASTMKKARYNVESFKSDNGERAYPINA